MSSAPVKLQPHQALNLSSSMTGSIQLRSGGSVEAGTVLPAPDGDRFFYQTAVNDVVYILVKPASGHHHNLGQFFVQGRWAFTSDIELGAVAAGVARRTAATKKVMEAWADLMMGAVGCASGPAGWAVAGFNAAMAGGKFLANYDTYVKAIETILYNQSYFKERTPTLYQAVLADLLFNKIKDKMKGNFAENVGKMVAGKGVAGKLIGLFIGKLGEDYLKRSLKTINALFKEVLIKIARHMDEHPGAKLSEEQIEGLAGHVVKQLAPSRSISQADARKIVLETASGRIRTNLMDISKALDLL